MAPPTRRRVLQAGGLASVASVAGCLTGFGGNFECSDGRPVHNADVALPESAAWPSFQYDAANTGHNPDATGPTRSVGVAWRHSACTEADSGTVVHGGRAYAGGLVVDGRTGQSRGGEWHGHMSTPAVTDDALYVSAIDLEARDPESGALQWTFETDVDAGALPPPKVATGTVYVPGSIDDPTLYAVDADSNDEQWRYTTTADVSAPVAVGDGAVFAVDGSRTVHAVHGETGDELWTRTLGHGAARIPPVVDDGRLYWGSRNGLYALDTADGSTRWRRTDGIGGAAAVADGTVFTVNEETVAALDATDGSTRWRTTPSIGRPTPPVVADGVLYVGYSRHTGSAPVVAFDAANGEERWRVNTRDVVFGDYTRAGINQGIAVVDGAVYVGTAPGDLYAITEDP